MGLKLYRGKKERRKENGKRNTKAFKKTIKILSYGLNMLMKQRELGTWSFCQILLLWNLFFL